MVRPNAGKSVKRMERTRITRSIASKTRRSMKLFCLAGLFPFTRSLVQAQERALIAPRHWRRYGQAFVRRNDALQPMSAAGHQRRSCKPRGILRAAQDLPGLLAWHIILIVAQPGRKPRHRDSIEGRAALGANTATVGASESAPQAVMQPGAHGHSPGSPAGRSSDNDQSGSFSGQHMGSVS
jgi:hypothetical protein